MSKRPNSPVAAAPLAILSALAQEQAGLVELLEQATAVQHAGRTFHCGLLSGKPVVLALARIGKVAAATTCAALAERFGVGSVVFTGVAGGTGPQVGVGDVVVGTGFVQHDLDASPLFPRFEVPLTGQALFPAHAGLQDALYAACCEGLAQKTWAGRAVQVHRGLIASGDVFLNSQAQVQSLMAAMAEQGHVPLAVEMECAAVAQTCADYNIPFAAVRTISDRADANAPGDFAHFVQTVASRYAQDIVLRFMQAV